MLSAVGIPSTISSDGADFCLQVDVDATGAALGHLERYEIESRPAPAPVSLPPMRIYPHAWIGCVAYIAVLMSVAFLNSSGLWRLDAFDTGELDAGRVQSGQWWRAWTALTLHLDGSHLGANLAAGVWFGYLAARQIGGGASWLLIVIGAGIANLLEALLAPASYHAVGASTAVFTALGMLAAHTWRIRFLVPQRWALRWGPLIGGVSLLAFTGTGGQGTDVGAHLAGFLVGILFGAVAALQWAGRIISYVPQWLMGLVALASIAIAWACALGS